MTCDHSRGAHTEAVRALEAEFGALITQVRRVIAENADRVSPGMLPGAYKVFTTIARLQPVTLSAVAETMHADKGQTSRAVRELEELGLVARTRDPGDGRSSLLAPTALGTARLADAREPRPGVLLTALEKWDADDIRDLTRLLRALAAGEAPAPLERAPTRSTAD